MDEALLVVILIAEVKLDENVLLLPLGHFGAIQQS